MTDNYPAVITLLSNYWETAVDPDHVRICDLGFALLIEHEVPPVGDAENGPDPYGRDIEHPTYLFHPLKGNAANGERFQEIDIKPKVVKTLHWSNSI